MGRQIALIANPEDERELLRFIRTLSPIRVFQTFALTPEELWLDGWEHQDLSGFAYSIWPQDFPWEPTYGVTGGPGCPPERTGFHYFANANTAPVLELSRGDLEQNRAGRLYWGGNFSAPQGLAYDQVAFGKLVDQVWRWVRRHGQKLDHPVLGAHYFLPNAWSRRCQPSEQLDRGAIE